MIAWSRIDRITNLELPDPGPCLDDISSDVVPQDEWRAIPKKKLELSIPNLGVQQIHSCGVNPDQDIIVLQFRFRHVDQVQSAFFFVLINDERLHSFPYRFRAAHAGSLSCLRRM